jgi:hypothetical protein
MMVWALLHPKMTMERLGFLPMFLDEANVKCARDQINEAYQHGGGWQPFRGFELLENGDLQYIGDPPTRRLAIAMLRNEEISFYEHAWVVIKQPDGKWEVARID